MYDRKLIKTYDNNFAKELILRETWFNPHPPVNMVTVTAARLFRCFADSVGVDDASFAVQIMKLMKVIT